MARYCAFNTSTFGSTGQLSIPSWTGAGNSNWSIDFDFVVTSLSTTARIGGNSSATTRGVEVTATGELRVGFVTGLTSAAGIVSANTRYTARLESVGTTKSLYIKQFGGSFGSALASVTDNNPYLFEFFGKAGSSSTRVFNFYGFSLSGGTYSETWDGTNAPSTGTEWTGANGNQITLAGTQGTANAWWIYYNSITTTGIPNNTLGAALNQACAINLNNYFTGATSYAIQSGSLPAGLSIVGNQIVGTPTAAQTTTLVIRASNSIDLLYSATITFKTGLWYLQCAGGGGDATAPIVTIPNWIPSNQSNWACRIKIKTGSDITTDRMICGRDDNNTNPNQGFKAALINNTIVFLYKTYWNTSNWLQYSVTTNTEYDFLYKVTATTFELWNNATNTLLVSKSLPNRATAGTVMGSSVVGQNATLNSTLNQSPAGVGYYNVDLIDYATPSNSRFYDTSSSGGVGNVWPSSTGANNGTQAGTWPADDSEWVFYSSGDTVASTAAWSVSPLVWQGSAAVSAPTFSSVTAWSVSPMTWQGAAAASVPAFQSSAAWSITPLQWQAQAEPMAPGAIASAAAWSVSPIVWQSAAAATVPVFQSSAAWAVSPLQWQGVAQSALPDATASVVSWSITPLQWQSSASATVPIFTASAAWQITPMRWQVSASIGGAPVFVARGATIIDSLQSHVMIETMLSNSITERLQTSRIYE